MHLSYFNKKKVNEEDYEWLFAIAKIESECLRFHMRSRRKFVNIRGKGGNFIKILQYQPLEDDDILKPEEKKKKKSRGTKRKRSRYRTLI